MGKTNHRLYQTGDTNTPESIKDRNGDVVLDLCKICGKGESDLKEDCLSTRKQALKWWNSLTYSDKRLYWDTHMNGLFIFYSNFENRDIEELWRKINFIEVNKIDLTENKTKLENFYEYIAKFSKEDKMKCIEILMKSTNTDKCHLCSEGFL